ncbi:MAG: penicillin-binding transpeptidase domain-containing protein [Anaerocolumna sp.]
MRNNPSGKKIKKFTNRMRGKLMFIFVLLTLFMLGLIARLFVINYTDGERYEKRVLSQQAYSSKVIPYQRGSILDRNKTILAVSEKVYNVILDVNNMLGDEDYLKPTRKALTESFESITVDTINDLVENKSESRYSILLKGISYDEMTKFKEKQEKDTDIKGVWFEEDYVRKYPYKTLASDIIGFTTSGNVGNWGIEQFYNEQLNGTNGIEFGYINEELNLESTVKGAVNGNTIISTIDANVQGIVQQHIKEFNEEYGSENIGILIMNPNNGEILAMASNEEYDLNNPTDLTSFYTAEEISGMTEKERLDNLNAIWRNYVISDTFEPGSTFKPFTIAAALEEALIHKDDTYICDGYEMVKGVRINCSKRTGHGVITLEQALMYSCNDALMQIVEKEGKSLFYDYQSFFGFGSKTGIDLPGESSGILVKEENLNPVELATSSFGQTFTTTMVQIASGFSSLINGGYHYKPHIVKQIISPQGAIVLDQEKELVRISTSKETSEFVMDSMFETVEEGTASGAKVSGYKVGGKTGTAQKLPRDAKTYLVSFVGCVPADDPEIVIYVVVDEPQNVVKQADSSIATKLASRILNDVLPFLEIYPSSDVEVEEAGDTELSLPSTETAEPNTTENNDAEESNEIETEGEDNTGVSGEDGNTEGNNVEETQEGLKENDNEGADLEGQTNNEDSSSFNPDFIENSDENEEEETSN